MADAPSPEGRPPVPPAFPVEIGAAVVVLVLVGIAVGAGVGLGRRAVPAPPAPITTPSPTPSPAPTVEDPVALEARAFAQPLTAGCSTGNAVWIFSDGGAAIRWDGELWSIPDPTLRSHLSVACRPGEATVVGRGGTLLHVEDDRRALRPDSLGTEDLAAVAITLDGALAVGDAGTVLLQSPAGWRRFGADLVVGDLRGVAVAIQRLVRPGRAQAWIVGAGGVTYRLIETGWEAVPSGTTATLRAVLIQSDAALAAGDGGTILRFLDGAWKPLPSGTDATIRAVTLVGPMTAWFVGDRGTVVEVSGDDVHRVDIGTTCTLRAVFTQDGATWIVGSDGIRGGAWRISPSGTSNWGSC